MWDKKSCITLKLIYVLIIIMTYFSIVKIMAYPIVSTFCSLMLTFW